MNSLNIKCTLLCLCVTRVLGFSPQLITWTATLDLQQTTSLRSKAIESALFVTPRREGDKLSKSSRLRNFIHRFDTISAAGLDPEQVQIAGLFGRIKKIHNPRTYLILAALAGFRWDWCFRNPYYWFAVGFCIKWYRARYVYKIPVWDRQPNWNNIITSKEQEKDLKAFTCKKCGSTIFIAKTREFFFEGNTGIGGLGCFSCGAKGKENFVMDRDRILEDVADEDDYFEYERPLDFVSRAERRKILKEAQGDEEKANELLVKRSASDTINEEVPTTSSSSSDVVDTNASAEESNSNIAEVETPKKRKKNKKHKKDSKPKESEKQPDLSDDDLDFLDMDSL